MLLILIKNFHEMLHYTNNSLLSCDKIIPPLLELIGHLLSISEYVLVRSIAKRFGHQTMSSKSIKTSIFYKYVETCSSCYFTKNINYFRF